MTYTINGKEWTEFDINKRCAELYNGVYRDYCNNPADTDAIIDKCWEELMIDVDCEGNLEPYADMSFGINWQYLMGEHNCTKLVAACICYIEMQEET
jgi:hypothetical protein